MKGAPVDLGRPAGGAVRTGPPAGDGGGAPRLSVLEWVVRQRPAVVLEAADRPDLSSEMWEHPPLRAQEDLDFLLSLLRGAAMTARADHEAARGLAAVRVGEIPDGPVSTLWGRISAAVANQIDLAARYRLAEAAKAVGPVLGGSKQAWIQRTQRRRSAPRHDWQVVVDVALDGFGALAWTAVARAALHPGVFHQAHLNEVWPTASGHAANALNPVLDDLDKMAHAAGIVWSVPSDVDPASWGPLP